MSGWIPGGRSIAVVLTTSSLLASVAGRELTSRSGRISLNGTRRRAVRFTLQRDQEGIKRVVLTKVKRMRMWKRIAFVGGLCLRGKVWKIWGMMLTRPKDPSLLKRQEAFLSLVEWFWGAGCAVWALANYTYQQASSESAVGGKLHSNPSKKRVENRTNRRIYHHIQ